MVHRTAVVLHWMSTVDTNVDFEVLVSTEGAVGSHDASSGHYGG